MKPTELRAFWDDSHRRILKNKEHSRYAEAVFSESKPNSVICDLGGGTGTESLYFLSEGHQVDLYDISPIALQIAHQKAVELGYELGTHQSNFGDSNFTMPENKYDLVYSRLALHYFLSAELAAILSEIYNSLKPGGLARLTLKSPGDDKEMEFLYSNAKELEPGVFEEDGQIKTRFSIQQLEDILLKAGIPEVASTVKQITEDLSGRVDSVKSGNLSMLLNEIVLTRR